MKNIPEVTTNKRKLYYGYLVPDGEEDSYTPSVSLLFTALEQNTTAHGIPNLHVAKGNFDYDRW